MVKPCRRCNGELHISQFYKHPGMADGYLNYCKQCTKARVLKHRKANIELTRAYDRARSYKRKAARIRVIKAWRQTHPERMAAHNAVARAIKRGTLTRKSCWCGKFGEAHHPDYSKPLEVTWLCRIHHEQAHHG